MIFDTITLPSQAMAAAASGFSIGLCSREAVRAAPRVSAETCEASAAGTDVPAETRMDSEAALARSAATPVPESRLETSESSDGLQVCAGTHNSNQATPAPGLDAGQAVIEQAGGLHVGTEVARRVACDVGLVVLHHGADLHTTQALPCADRRRASRLIDRDVAPSRPMPARLFRYGRTAMRIPVSSTSLPVRDVVAPARTTRVGRCVRRFGGGACAGGGRGGC